MAIWIYDKYAADFSNNGMGSLMPRECTVSEEANADYSLTMAHPIDKLSTDDRAKWKRIKRGTIIAAPVATRTMPEIVISDDLPAVVTTLEVWETVVKAKVRQKASSTSKVLRELKANSEWVVTLKQGTWYKGRDSKGRSGWIAANQLQYLSTVHTDNSTSAIERVVPAAFDGLQLFRVYRVIWGIDSVTAYARHISYGFNRNLIGNCALQFSEGFRALAAMQDALYNQDSDYECFTNITYFYVKTLPPSVDWTRIKPIKALLDPEIGFCKIYGAECVRDNFSIYLLRNAGMDRGVTIAYGKNLKGITWDENDERVVTRYVPVGQDKNGQPLLLPELFVDSEHIGDYDQPYIDVLDVPEAKVGEKDESGEKITLERAYEIMRYAVQDKFATGIDLPEISVKIEFVNLGDTEEFAAFRQLQQVYMHDTVHIEHARLGITFAAKVIKFMWDANQLRHKSIEISTVTPAQVQKNTASHTPSWTLAQVQGDKLRDSSISAKSFSADVFSAMGENIVLGADTVTTDNIAANAVTNKHIRDESVAQAKIAGLVTIIANLDARIAALEQR